jgi:hypothetical protein
MQHEALFRQGVTFTVNSDKGALQLLQAMFGIVFICVMNLAGNKQVLRRAVYHPFLQVFCYKLSNTELLNAFQWPK